jgi:hypothetical protein
VLGLVLALGILGSCARDRQQTSSNPLPTENMLEVNVSKGNLLGKAFMPAGTLARYRRGNQAYEIFIAEMATETDSAIVLAHWDQALKNPKVVKSLDAYYGTDEGRPIYVFAKGRWVAGITGLTENEADQQARALASRL